MSSADREAGPPRVAALPPLATSRYQSWRPGRGLPVQTLAKHGYNVLHWTEAGMAFWAISDLNAAELKTFAETYAGAY